MVFDKNGGDTEADPNNMSILNGDTISPEPTAPTRTGYTFDGWFVDSLGNTAWDFANDTVTNDMTLYADWTPIPYTVVFDENGGDTAANPATMVVDYDALISPEPTAPSLTGYAFVGWYLDLAGTIKWDFAADTVSGDMNLYAKYAQLFTVIFDENGGDSAANPTTMMVAEGFTIDPPPAPPALADYVFVGWFTDAAATNAWSLGADVISGDLTLYAGWTDITYQVTFDNNGGSTNASPSVMTVANGAIINPEPSPPTRSGYAFEGWYIDEAGTIPWDWETDTVSGSLTLYAKWSELLSLNGSPSDGMIYQDGRIEITPNIPGGVWSFDEDMVSVKYSGTTAVFTGLRSGTTTVEYTVDGQTTVYTITISETELPATGQDYTLIIIIGLLSAIVSGALLVIIMNDDRMKKSKEI